MSKVCPRCFSDYTEDSAISRRDNITGICSVCGNEEALIDWFNHKQRWSEIPGEVMEREDRLARSLTKKK